MKILEITEFSAGACGVWTRVSSEAREFARIGHEVRVFSSDIIKGTDKRTDVLEENIEGVRVKRFRSKSNILSGFLSRNVNHFRFEEELIRYKPDVVITHLIHPHSFRALGVCLRMNIPCYLVTHAPFNVSRGRLLGFATDAYYRLVVQPNIIKFSKIIAVTKWEYPYLIRLGVPREKIVYIPNGIPKEFLSIKPSGDGKDKVLFLGRIAPVKNLETLIIAAKILPGINFSLVGPAEKEYARHLKSLIGKMNNVKIMPPVYNLKEKIRLIDSCRIFVLPSIREAMPQVLLEAMARRKIVISSKTDGGKEIIKDGKNGFLFEKKNYRELAEIIKKNIGGNKKVEMNAGKEAKKYNWERLIKGYEKILR